MRNLIDAGEPATSIQESILETAEWCYAQHCNITPEMLAENYNVTIPTARIRIAAISHHTSTQTTFVSKPYSIRVHDVDDRHANSIFNFAQRVMAGSQVQYVNV